MPKDTGQAPEGTVIEFQAKKNVRENGRILVASGNQSRNRDFWTGKAYRLVPGGMRLENWEKNPLVFYMHHMGIPLAKAEMFIEDGQLWASDSFEFHRKEIPVFSFGSFGMFDTGAIADLWEEEFLNAVSIHIILSKQDEANVTESEDEIVIPTSEVIEASIVTVPGDADAVREKDYLQEFAIRLRAKGVEQDMAECVACSFGDVWRPSVPIWAEQSESTASAGSIISVPEVRMSKKTANEATLDITETAEETPVEEAGEVIEAVTPESNDEVVIEQEIELPVVEFAEAIAQDAEAMRAIASALVNMPEFVQSMLTAVSAQVQTLEPVVTEVLPQRITVKLVGSGQREQAQVEQPAQEIVRPITVKQAVEERPRAAPVALPATQNGTNKKPGVLDLLPPG